MMTVKELTQQLKQRAKSLKTNSTALAVAMKKKQTPLVAKVLIASALLYVVSPIDLIPDFIPILGALDDLIIVPIFFALAIRHIPTALFIQCQQEAQEMWPNGLPVKWYYALPFITFWLILLLLIVGHWWV